MTLWAIRTPKGKILEGTAQPGWFEAECEFYSCDLTAAEKRKYDAACRGGWVELWKFAKKLGYKAVKVKLVEVEGRKRGAGSK